MTRITVTRDTCHGRGVTGESVTQLTGLTPGCALTPDPGELLIRDHCSVTGELHASAGLVADITNVLNTISAVGSSSGTICLVVDASKCHYYFIEEDK